MATRSSKVYGYGSTSYVASPWIQPDDNPYRRMLTVECHLDVKNDRLRVQIRWTEPLCVINPKTNLRKVIRGVKTSFDINMWSTHKEEILNGIGLEVLLNYVDETSAPAMIAHIPEGFLIEGVETDDEALRNTGHTSTTGSSGTAS